MRLACFDITVSTSLIDPILQWRCIFAAFVSSRSDLLTCFKLGRARPLAAIASFLRVSDIVSGAALDLRLSTHDHRSRLPRAPATCARIMIMTAIIPILPSYHHMHDQDLTLTTFLSQSFLAVMPTLTSARGALLTRRHFLPPSLCSTDSIDSLLSILRLFCS